ncbi:unnamed protein product (plasmid) [Mycetohabitans rhizoxinica HKI 454]|uniref:Uncharacterized protein n=2 Tax=Burkholderiaceae TaxID=119060 RepID=E5AUT3_MYCRK|nr:unnamed protein product [Mycetohabitans rhizoxinica HKI 454]
MGCGCRFTATNQIFTHRFFGEWTMQDSRLENVVSDLSVLKYSIRHGGGKGRKRQQTLHRRLRVRRWLDALALTGVVIATATIVAGHPTLGLGFYLASTLPLVFHGR